ncbi:oligoribonuclease [Cryobacterium flavum]|uniref:Oligoribonuclease n=2 Tax=Cryobacterium flavum TaxID=1424659 RepID=A0ABY2I6B5_9MICO|nr:MULTISPECIES: oligoribonuclease [Cryobacterium]TFB82148.1 oligoribonuclease [Cryobacterium flavum]TFD09415.1 oligoribonuclease [Cryobacterium sp. TMT1-66-1]TFD11860.1 oligoribonuclease [Cryobacterium sp. TMT1-2-2]
MTNSTTGTAPTTSPATSPTSKSPDRLVWIDCEMTGLDLDRDELVEIAVVITDYDLNVLDPGLDIIIKPNDSALENMGDFVRNMHTSSGLITEIPGGVSAAEAEFQVLEYVLKFIPSEQKAPLAGNSIGTDRAFLTRYMPRLDNQLHYRNVDVSSIKELARRWYPRVYFNAPAKDGGHRALADILESIRELAYYRQTVFVADPGPTSDEAKSHAAEVVHLFASEV